MKEYLAFVRKNCYLITAAFTWLFVFYEICMWGFPEIIKFVCNVTLTLTIILAAFHILSCKFKNKLLHILMKVMAVLLVIAWLLGIYGLTMLLKAAEVSTAR